NLEDAHRLSPSQLERDLRATGPSLRPGHFLSWHWRPFLEKNASRLNLCCHTCPAFSEIGRVLFDVWVISACHPGLTFVRVLATPLSIVRHVTPAWAHIPRRTIQSSRRFGNQDCLHAALQTIG